MRPADAPADTQSEQELLDGLPIPAATIARPGGAPARIERANDGFRLLAGYDERLRGSLVAEVPLFGRGPLAAALQAFLDGDERDRQFESAVGERCFQVRFARLSGIGRCLLTLIDRTGERGPERSYRSEPVRDPLTGLPNASGFEERVAELLDHPNFKPGSYAVLSVALAVGSNEELVLAAARRLLSAVRAGDLLARTSAAEFRILMRLDQNVAEAEELADRLRTVLAARFRLSTFEVRASYSVVCAPLSARST